MVKDDSENVLLENNAWEAYSTGLIGHDVWILDNFQQGDAFVFWR